MTEINQMLNTAPQKVEMPHTYSGEMRALLALGLPMAATQLIQFVIYTIDVVMLGRVGEAELAAAALGSVIYFALWMLGAGPVFAVSPLVSQALGANQRDYHDVRISVRMALWLVAFMLPFLLFFIQFTEEIALRLGQDPVISAMAEDYVLALALGWPCALAVMVLRNFLAAINKTVVPLILVSLAVVINTGLNYLLIFGKFGFPEWGLVGAGIASTLSYIASLVFFILYCQWDKTARRFRVFKRFWRANTTRFVEIFKLGWPISLTTLFEGMLFNAAVIVMGAISVTAQAAYQVALNIVALAFMLPWGLSMAGSVRIGLGAGADNGPAVYRAATTTMIAAIAGMSVIAIIVALFPNHIAAAYLDMDVAQNQVLAGLVISFLPIAAAFMLFDATQVAANQLLRGLKDVRWAMFATGISYWVIGFPICYWLGLHTDLGARGVWYGLMAGLITASVLLSARLIYLLRRNYPLDFPAPNSTRPL